MNYKIIKNYKNYIVTDCGKVFNIKSNKQLKERKHTKGYLRVSLCQKGDCKDFYIHRLVAEAFVPNPNNYLEVNHINSDKKDNNVSNLEWCTRSHNMQHCVESGNHKSPNLSKEDSGCSKLTQVQVDEIRSLYESGNYRQIELAKMFNISRSNISSIITKKTWR